MVGIVPQLRRRSCVGYAYGGTLPPEKARSNLYSKTSLQNSAKMEKISKELVPNRLLHLLQQAASEGAGLDVLQLGGAIGMDYISAFVFCPGCWNRLFMPDRSTQNLTGGL